MLRRIAAGGLAATLFLVVLAGCGGPEASVSPSASAAAQSSAPSPVASQGAAPTTAPSEPAASAATTRKLLSVCAGVAVRKGPTMTDQVFVRVPKLTKVRVVGTVTGDPYQATTCGTSGADWVKIDRINGTSVKKLYGVPFAYAAAGFFE